VLLLLAVAGGCARAPRPTAVSPADIPALIARTQQEPTNADVRFRLAAALAAAERYDTAIVVARAGELLAPDNALGPLIIGGSQEHAGRYDLAIATYRDFANAHPGARGVAALRARAELALRAGAEQTARQALARETELAQQPPEPATLAVLPLVIAGDSSFQPLSRGLAELLTTDLALIRTLRLLERLQIGAVLDELKLAESQRVDPVTAARVGRLLRAERLVQGVGTIATNQPVRLAATVVSGAGVVRPVGQVTGPFKGLLDLEKQLVFNLSDQLGIRLTEAERQRILAQGTKSLAAFLAYSRGLDAMDRGDYAAAARNFGEAVRADPGFQAAQQGQEAAVATPVVQQAGGGEIVTVVQAVEQVTAPSEPATRDALSAATLEIAPTTGDVIAQVGSATSGTTTIDRHLAPESQGLPSIISVVNGITIIFRRPP